MNIITILQTSNFNVFLHGYLLQCTLNKITNIFDVKPLYAIYEHHTLSIHRIITQALRELIYGNV